MVDGEGSKVVSWECGLVERTMEYLHYIGLFYFQSFFFHPGFESHNYCGNGSLSFEIIQHFKEVLNVKLYALQLNSYN